MIASAIASESPTGTSRPHFPSSSISLGPWSQSVLTTGVPHAIACTSTFGNPSYLDECTISLALDMYANGLTRNPGRSTCSAIPSCSASRNRFPLSGPSPRTTSLAGCERTTRANALSNVAWSFSGTRRPTESTTGTPVSPNQDVPPASPPARQAPG